MKPAQTHEPRQAPDDRSESLARATCQRRRRIENGLAKPMFVLAMLFLVGMATLVGLVRNLDGAAWNQPPTSILLIALLLLWLLFLVEAVVRFWLGSPERRSWKPLGVCLAAGLLPPLRLAVHSRTRPQHVWLPWMGWQQIDFDLQKTLERAFSAPMFLMALLILPVLAVEYFWSDAVASYPLLRGALAVGVGVIWIAFTVEFIIRISVAEKKLRYAVNHWIDLAVVLLPMLEFMPFLRLLRVTRLMRLERLARIAKYYRLYGVAGKSWRGLVGLQLIRRLISRSPKARVSRLKAALEDKKKEIGELRREADYYRRHLRAAEQELTDDEKHAHEGESKE